MANEADRLSEQYELHQLIRGQLRNAWSAFFARFGSLRPVQLLSIPPILAGKNVLVTAPTAGGKTEAVIAPLCELMSRNRWVGLSTILVTPTRALVNDLYERLVKPCEHMSVRIGRKTADHAISDEVDEQLLVTTPESLESMLTFRRQILCNVRAIVVDEIHLLDGGPRGDQLRLLLARLSAFLHYHGGEAFTGLQCIAMSATVPDPRRLANAYLGVGAEIIAVPGQRQLVSKIVVADGSEEERVRMTVQAIEEFPDVCKVLVFCNSRRDVDSSTGFFAQGNFTKAAVFGHHGSLSKHQREQTEARFKSEGRAICVATMTLEVGIDIGDIDLVVCMDPPYSLSSFLQRIGRGCRRLHGRTRVLCMARDRSGEILFESMVRQAALGLPVGPVTPLRCSVLVQQVLAYLKQVDKNCRTLAQFARVMTTNQFPLLSLERLKLMLDDMVQQGLLDLRGSVYQPASAGWEFIESSRIFSNIAPTPTAVGLIDADSGKVVATVAGVLSKYVRVAGKSYEVLPGGNVGETRIRGLSGIACSPDYFPVKVPLASDLGMSIAGRFGLPPDRLPVIAVAGGVIVMTWLGKLLNTALGGQLKSAGRIVKVREFSLVLEGTAVTDVVALLQAGVAAMIDKNPFGQMAVENMADLGPYFVELSIPMKEQARQDWLDQDFLKRWSDSITGVELIPAETNRGQDLAKLP